LKETKDAEKSTKEIYIDIYIREGNEKTKHTRGDLVGGNRRTDKTSFEVFTAALLRILPFWEVMLCH
jgi:hypothetical protein